MTTIHLKSLSNDTITIAAEAADALRRSLRGPVCLPGDPGYEEARSLWNAMIDRRPAMIVRAMGAADVIRTVRFAAEQNALLAVRGGGHNIAGNAVCDGGLMLDLSLMKSVQVDPSAKRVRVEPGATLGDLDKETTAFGHVVPTGVNSTTGVAGLTLGGGFGWTTRKFGMTVDSLIGADLVTADGKLLRVNGNENSNLFWAIRGGGGNFGVVTSFFFRMHAMEPTVLAGLLVHPFDHAPDLLRRYRDMVAEMPDELTVWVVMRKAPPLPVLPEAWHGREVMIFALCWCGEMAAGERAVMELRRLGRPIADLIGPQPFTAWQSAFDPLLTPGARNYWKSHDFLELSDGAIDAMLAAIRVLPTDESEIFLAHLGGAMGRVPPEATAYALRKPHFVMNVHTRWRSAADDERCIGWARNLFRATAAHAAGSVYVNFMPDDEPDRVAAAYGPSYARLSEIKRHYDPHNLFRLNQNIAPAAHEERAAG